jgi:arylsulfatase A-like enzyme
LDNTILVYTSDHGLLVGQYGLYGKTNASNPQNFYEETIRIPLIFFAPGEHIRSEQNRDEMVDLLDLHATVMDFATRGRPSTSKYGPGRSLRPLLAGDRNTNWRTVQFAERGNARMVTDGRWKLVRYYRPKPNQAPIDRWYDLVHPFGERHISAAPRRTVSARLIAEMERFFENNETPAHTGRDIWNQPAPNARSRDDVNAALRGR